MLRMVILDIDGTLMDTNYLHVEAWARALQAVNYRIPRSTIHRQIGKGGDLMLEDLGIDKDVSAQANDLHSEFYAQTQHHGYPLPGAKELIRRIHSNCIAVWLATSAKSEELDHHIQALDAKDKFAGIVSSEDVNEAKPAPDVFQETLRRSGIAPEDSIVVGDTIWDIQAAQSCGLQTIAVLTGGAFSRQEFREAGAVAVHVDCIDLLGSGFPASFDFVCEEG
ncbi:MAG: HAD family hydrolase [Nitrospirales bacterium]